MKPVLTARRLVRIAACACTLPLAMAGCSRLRPSSAATTDGISTRATSETMAPSAATAPPIATRSPRPAGAPTRAPSTKTTSPTPSASSIATVIAARPSGSSVTPAPSPTWDVMDDDYLFGQWPGMVPSLVGGSDIVALVVIRRMYPPRYGTADGREPTRDPTTNTLHCAPTKENSRWQTFRVEVEHYFKSPHRSATELFIDDWIRSDQCLIADGPEPFRVDHVVEGDEAIIFARSAIEDRSPVSGWLRGEIAERRQTGRIVGYSNGAEFMLLLGPYVLPNRTCWHEMANRYFNAIEYSLGTSTPMPTETPWRNPYTTATPTATAEILPTEEHSGG